MKINQILSLCCDFLGLKEQKDMLIAQPELVNDEKLNQLLSCLNIAYQEILTDYLPSIETEEVVTKDGKINFSKLSSYPSGIVSVKDEQGKKQNFIVTGDCVVTNPGKLYISYKLTPKALEINQQIDSILSERLLSYATCKEFLLMQDLSDEALCYEKRYKDSLGQLMQKKTSFVMPKRLWLK